MAFFFEAVCAVRSLFSSDGELGENLSVLFTLCVKMWKCLHPHTCSLWWCVGLISNSALSPLQSLTPKLPPI